MANLRKLKTYKEVHEFISGNRVLIGEMYLDKDMSARNIAENQNIHFTQNFATVLLRTFGKKGAGHGGARVGSGNKLGIRFCGSCRKTLSKTELKKKQCKSCNYEIPAKKKVK